MAKIVLRIVLMAAFFFVLSYLWQCLPSWASGASYPLDETKNITFIDLQSEVEKETANQAINPFLASGVKS